MSEENGLITNAELGRMVRRRIRVEKLSQLDVVRATGLSRSTVNRVWSRPDLNTDAQTFGSVVQWMGVPFERVVNGRIAYYESEPFLQKIDALIYNDPLLGPEERELLSEMFEAAYRALTFRRTP